MPPKRKRGGATNIELLSLSNKDLIEADKLFYSSPRNNGPQNNYPNRSWYFQSESSVNYIPPKRKLYAATTAVRKIWFPGNFTHQLLPTTWPIRISKHGLLWRKLVCNEPMNLRKMIFREATSNHVLNAKTLLRFQQAKVYSTFKKNVFITRITCASWHAQVFVVNRINQKHHWTKSERPCTTNHRIKKGFSICQLFLCLNLISFPLLRKIKPKASNTVRYFRQFLYSDFRP